MNLIKTIFLLIILCVLATGCQKDMKTTNSHSVKNEHPNLILTKKGVANIRKQLGRIPVFDKTLASIKAEVDAEIQSGIDVPIPKDFSGGYTHARHKRNFLMLQRAGVLFQILEDDTYAIYVRDMFMAYAKLYPTLPIHPQPRSYARGKLFWQCLNDSNWLVYSAQAYDCIYSWLSHQERQHLENDLFIPFANFISKDNPQFFNRVHNHSTWGNVAVGMIALVMNNEDLLEKALYGLKTDNLNAGMKDNDGGFIYVEGQKLGFFGNLEEPFSPDGYYTEGPYYQRYAMYPFLIFAQALHNVKPEMRIFEYKEGVLLKAVDALLNLSDAKGNFFPINDGQKGMSYYSRELVTAVNIAYHFGGQNSELLSISKKQDRVVLDDTGLSVAIGLKNGSETPFIKQSIELRDGPNGDEGGVGILRQDDIELVFKYAAQGLSHGHYDKLSFSMYEKGDEVIQDYGLARFVNIEQKGGGNYLKENKTWAKQTIAHNTLVQNERSHFEGKYEIGSLFHSEKYIFDSKNPNLQVASAKETHAYNRTEMHRTMVLIKDSEASKPIVLDIFRVSSDTQNQYDLPFYYLGQLIQTNFEYSSPKILSPLGESHGYQHLFKEGLGVSNGENAKVTWLLNNRFYTISSTTSKGDELILSRIGANDPAFNLRKEPGFIIRKPKQKDALFVSTLESHGTYSPVSELAINAYSGIQHIQTIYNDSNYTAVKIVTHEHANIFLMANQDHSQTSQHQLFIDGKQFNWVGTHTLKKIN